MKDPNLSIRQNSAENILDTEIETYSRTSGVASNKRIDQMLIFLGSECSERNPDHRSRKSSEKSGAEVPRRSLRRDTHTSLHRVQESHNQILPLKRNVDANLLNLPNSSKADADEEMIKIIKETLEEIYSEQIQDLQQKLHQTSLDFSVREKEFLDQIKHLEKSNLKLSGIIASKNDKIELIVRELNSKNDSNRALEQKIENA